MKTSIIITIEHPEDEPANGFIDYTLKPMLDDINADSEDGWSVKVNDLSAINELFEGIDPNSSEGLEIATSLIHSIQSHFKIVGVIWDRSTAEYVIGRELTSEEWQKVWETDEWQSLGSSSDADVYAIEEALSSAGIEE